MKIQALEKEQQNGFCQFHPVVSCRTTTDCITRSSSSLNAGRHRSAQQVGRGLGWAGLLVLGSYIQDGRCQALRIPSQRSVTSHVAC